VNTRIRKSWIDGRVEVGLIGEPVDLTYRYELLGETPKDIAKFAKSTKGFMKTLKGAKNPAIIIGQGALTGEDGASILATVGKLAKAIGAVHENWNGVNVLHTAAARVGGLDMGFLPGEGGKDVEGILDAAGKGEIETVFLLGADELDTATLTDTFVIYQGSHGDAGAHVADVILPGAAYTEKDGIYVNTEGRVQMASAALAPKGDAKEDWAIIRALSGHIGRVLPYDSLGALRDKLMADHPTFAGLDYAPGVDGDPDFDPVSMGETGTIKQALFGTPVLDFYMTNPIARASDTMAKCSALLDDIQIEEAAE